MLKYLALLFVVAALFFGQVLSQTATYASTAATQGTNYGYSTAGTQGTTNYGYTPAYSPTSYSTVPVNDFEFSCPLSSQMSSESISVGGSTTGVLKLLATLTVNNVDQNSRVWLTATVGWEALVDANPGRTDLTLQIFRASTMLGSSPTLIYTITDSALAAGTIQEMRATTGNFVDQPTGPSSSFGYGSYGGYGNSYSTYGNSYGGYGNSYGYSTSSVTYFLVASAPLATSALNVVGPITFTGIVLEGASLFSSSSAYYKHF